MRLRRGVGRLLVLMTLVGVFFAPAAADAEVIRIEITAREAFGADIDGQIGPYERWRGRVIYALEVDDAANRGIVDLDLAATDGNGRVIFYGDLEILAPADLSQAQPTVLYVVNNRGRRTMGGESFLLSRGYVTVSSGWIAQVPINRTRMRLEAPIALDSEDGIPVVGEVRVELVTDEATDRLAVGGGQQSFEPVIGELGEARLTRRLRERDPPEPVPRDRWRLGAQYDGSEEGSGLIELEMALEGGFEPGVIYDLTYLARGAVVQGTGFAGIRDLVSFLKHEVSEENPLRRSDGSPVAQRVIGHGLSQSGRALRQFLYDGFNADTEGRQVFDGVLPAIAGGGLGFFNHRFASPTLGGGQHVGHLNPVDQFPFTYGDETDPFTGETDGILRRAREDGVVPKVMHVDTSSEYWHRAGSLVVTDPTGARDAELPPEVRVYMVAGAQHVPAQRPSERGQQALNPNDYRPVLQALFLAMDRWVSDGVEPPASAYPTIAGGALTRPDPGGSGWQPLPDVTFPAVLNQPEQLDFGEAFAEERRIDQQPPGRTGNFYGVRVPGFGADNNERGGVQLPRTAVPVATYTGWNLRSQAIGAPTELLHLAGSRIPFGATLDARQASDPRQALSERYSSFDDYRNQYLAVAQDLIDQGYLLAEHLPAIEAVANQYRSLFEQ